jgi:coiled-coil and C2 domain-containing protein 1
MDENCLPWQFITIIYNYAGVENLYHYEAYERALEGALNLDLLYLKFLFLGPPRSGKTSTRRRLVQEIINLSSLKQPSPSTGVAETSDIIINFKRLTSEYSTIANSNWQSIMGANDIKSGEHEKRGHDISHVAQLIYQLIATTPLTQSAQEESEDKNECIQTSDENSKDSVVTDTQYSDINCSDKDDTATNKSSKTSKNVQLVHKKRIIQSKAVTETLKEQIELDNAFTKLTSILQSDSPKELQQLLKELIMINMVDVGGQPALLEMLPALTNGPALYCLFFRLDQDLRKHYPVQYHDPRRKTETVLKSSYCIEDTLCQALSSIGCFSQPDLTSSRILLFGTHKDKVDEGRISQIECELKESLERTKIYTEGLLSKTAKGSLFFTVDNMDGEESEIMNIRTDIEGIIRSCFSATPIPASWLMFRIVLHLLNKPIVSLAQCEIIARRLSMPTPVKEALWFFHHQIGSIMYYPEIPLMQDTVICDPQIIFDSISMLIIDRFVYSNRTLKSVEVDEFFQNGLFTMAQIEDKTEQQRSACLSLQQLIETLKHLNVVAEIKDDPENVDSEATYSPSPPKFIMPAVLKQASEEELSARPEPGIILGCPLMIHFKGGFVPFGVFCASIAHLLAKHMQEWKLHKSKVMKNKVTFNVNQKYFITLISRLQYFEIQVHGHSQVPKATFLSVVNTITETLQAIMSKMNYKQFGEASYISMEQSFDLGFTCCLGDSHGDHLMKVIEDNDRRYYALCVKDEQKTDLNAEHLIWFKVSEFNIEFHNIHRLCILNS